ncbi:hypothetical protein BGZ93_007697 [Podila epicladia]|nr:hypothetical protein BGZ93_007697 [Podila epicladia]
MHISILLAVCVTLTAVSTPFVNAQSEPNMGLVCPANIPFGTCAAETTVPLTNPSINIHLTVVVIEEEHESKEDEATVEDVPEAHIFRFHCVPEDVHTPTAFAPVFKSLEFQRLSHM